MPIVEPRKTAGLAQWLLATAQRRHWMKKHVYRARKKCYLRGGYLMALGEVRECTQELENAEGKAT
jgi:hypothetical protein